MLNGAGPAQDMRTARNVTTETDMPKMNNTRRKAIQAKQRKAENAQKREAKIAKKARNAK